MQEIFYSALSLLAKVDRPDSVPKVALNSDTIGGVFNGILMLAGAVCTIFIVIGAINYIISQGDAAKIKKAKDSIQYAGIGLVIVAVSFLIVRVVVNIF